jgi:anti-sigma28 factor (negative regulator of flagellin synthesis)
MDGSGGGLATLTVPRQGIGHTMDETVDIRRAHVERIHDTIKQQQYEVDANAVAEAILKRLLEGKTLDTR